MTRLEKFKKIETLIKKERVAILKAKSFLDTGVGSHAQRLLVKIAQIVEQDNG